MECPGCGKTCSTKYNMKRHWERYPECNQDTEIDHSFVCEKCNKCFKSKDGYTNHVNNTCIIVKKERTESEYQTMQKKIEDLMSIISKKDSEIKSLKDEIKRINTHFSSKYSSLRDINELRDNTYITQRLNELIPLDHNITSQGVLIRQVIAPLLDPYIVVKDPSRLNIVYRDGDQIVKKADIDDVLYIVRCPIGKRLSDIEYMKTNDSYRPGSIEHRIAYAPRRFRYPVLKALYKKTANIDPKDADL